MLVLTRRPGQVIRIGRDITVMIVEIRDGNVRVGIEAPKDVAVHRQEIFERIENSRR